MNLNGKIILALETAIEGGSVSILDGHSEIDCWIGASAVSKAEDVLAGVSALLDRNHLKKARIGLVAVSDGAGSSTGLKIGLATAQGLAKALGCGLLPVPLWDALAEVIGGHSSQTTTIVLPGGKSRFCSRQVTNGKVVSEIKFTDSKLLRQITTDPDSGNLLIHRRIMRECGLSKRPLITDLGENLAAFIGKYASDNK